MRELARVWKESPDIAQLLAEFVQARNELVRQVYGNVNAEIIPNLLEEYKQATLKAYNMAHAQTTTRQRRSAACALAFLRDQQIPGINTGLPDNIATKDYVHRDAANKHAADVPTILASRESTNKRKRYDSLTPSDE